jgi:ferredoxin--NADP+ reductase
VRFLGNVELGRDVSRGDLLRLYDQVVYAVGAESDRRLGIPGEDLPGSWSSTELVAWYNGHPDFAGADFPLHHEQVAVVGIGNVAMDCARVLARPAEDLATTDVADEALAALRGSHVTDVHILARRGPAQAKCTPPELKELGELDDVDVLVDAADLEGAGEEGELDRQAEKNMVLFRELAERGDRGSKRRIHFHFLVSPTEVTEADGAIGGLTVERNRLVADDAGRVRPRGTGETFVLPVTAVIRAIGYRSVALPDVPFDDRQGLIPNRDGRVVDAPGSDAVCPREYVVGWAKRGPSGLIGSNKPDSQQTVEAMLADRPTLPPAADEAARRPEAVTELLAERGVRWVTFADWQRLDDLEVARGAEQGRPRVKMCLVEEMLAALDETPADA